MTTHSMHPIASGFGFIESPRWHADRLWFVDYFAQTVLRLNLNGDAEVIAKIPGVPGGLGFLPDGTPLVVSQRDFKVLAIRPDGSLSLHADLSALARGAANELLVDGQGRAYVGHHGYDFFRGAPLQLSTLLLISEHGKVEVAADSLTFPNGMALSPDGHTLIVAESFARCLTAFTVDVNGRLSASRRWASLGEHTPDGICMDSEGAVWAASPLTGQFVRVRENEGVIDAIAAPFGRWAVACAFGGVERRTLFCQSAATTLEDMPKGLSKAFIDAIELDIGGAGIP